MTFAALFALALFGFSAIGGLRHLLHQLGAPWYLWLLLPIALITALGPLGNGMDPRRPPPPPLRLGHSRRLNPDRHPRRQTPSRPSAPRAKSSHLDSLQTLNRRNHLQPAWRRSAVATIVLPQSAGLGGRECHRLLSSEAGPVVDR